MNAASQATPGPPSISTLADAIAQELKELQSARSAVTLCSGELVGTFAGRFYYRFEIPEDVFPRPIERATFTFGQREPMRADGNIIALENQYITIAVDRDFGPVLPEIRCSWSYEEEIRPVIDRLQSSAGASSAAALLFRPFDEANVHAVGFEPHPIPNTPPDQLDAVRKIFQNKVTILWGPIHSGKSHTLSLAAANYLKGGKKVLFLAPENDAVDQTLLQVVEVGKQLGLSMEAIAARVDLPSLVNIPGLTPFSFEHQVEQLREEKRKTFQERAQLIAEFERVKIKQVLHEDFYQRTQDIREKMAEAKKQLDVVSKEVERLRAALTQQQQASMLERLKKGMSKDELAAVQKQLAEKQQAQKRLQSLHQSMTNEVTRLELDSPVKVEELQAYRLAVKRMEELGGIDVVRQAVQEYTAVNEAELLRTKSFVATSTSTVLVDPSLKGIQFDLVLVDDAQMIDLATLAALASLAREKLVIAGDPFQTGPSVLSRSEQADQWLRRDIFLFLAATDELSRLFEWSEKNARWVVFLSSHFATTPKLSLFMGSVLFDDKVNVFASPKARGKIYFIDTTELKSKCRQYAGRKRMLPFNDQQTKKTVECVKHALMEPNRAAGDVGVILPFDGPTLYTKLQLRLNGIRNVEVGTPATFTGRRKRAIVFDTTMAGVDYSMRAIDDRKAGDREVLRLLNSVLSSVEEDLYVLVDLSHLRTIYHERLFAKLLLLLQAEADQKQPVLTSAVKRFDDLDWEQRAKLLTVAGKMALPDSGPRADAPAKVDHELELKMKMLARQQGGKPPAGERNFEHEIFVAAQRSIGYRTDLNLVSQFMGVNALFRNSLATEQAAGRLPTDQCQNEKDFRAVMERWNLLIYETSGGSKTDVAYFVHKGPESRVRQEIRHLKAFYSSDADAVLEEGKQKIAVDVSRIFQELLGKSQPGNPAEWSSAYLSFLGRLESYLAWISEQVRK